MSACPVGNTIQPGDRVQWTQREGPRSTRTETLTGIVRSIKYSEYDAYAVVDVEPLGEIALPSLDKLTKVEVGT
jgi:hypothetical protein